MPRPDKGICKTISDEQVRHVAKEMIERGLSIKQGCAIAGIKDGTLRDWRTGTTPKNQDWHDWIEVAKAERVAYWMKKLEFYGDEKNSAGVKAAEKALFAFDDRFRKDGVPGATGIQIVIHQGPKPIAAEVISVRPVTVGQESLPAPGAQDL